MDSLFPFLSPEAVRAPQPRLNRQQALGYFSGRGPDRGQLLDSSYTHRRHYCAIHAGHGLGRAHPGLGLSHLNGASSFN